MQLAQTFITDLDLAVEGAPLLVLDSTDLTQVEVDPQMILTDVVPEDYLTDGTAAALPMWICLWAL